MLYCPECNQPADNFSDVIFVNFPPLPGEEPDVRHAGDSAVIFHKQCAPVSEEMQAIYALRLNCPVVAKCWKLKDSSNLSYRQMLELMVVALAEVNTGLHNQLIREITRKRIVSDVSG